MGGRKFSIPEKKEETDDDEELVQVVNVYRPHLKTWKKKAEDQELVQFTQFPAWVETEEDMEKFFKQQHTKVTRRDSGNGGVNPRTGKKFIVPETEEKDDDEELVQVVNV